MQKQRGNVSRKIFLLSGLIFIGIRRQKSCQNEPANSRQLELPHPPGMDWRVSPDPSPLLNASPLLWWGCGVRQKGKKVQQSYFRVRGTQFCPAPSSTRDTNSHGESCTWAAHTHLPALHHCTRGQRTRWKTRSWCGILHGLLFVPNTLLINLSTQSQMEPVKLNTFTSAALE